MIPASGAEYPYLKEAFGTVPAFLFAWTSSIVLKPSAVAIVGKTFVRWRLYRAAARKDDHRAAARKDDQAMCCI